MTQVDGLVGLIFLALKVLALVGAVYAIVHAVRQRPDAFTAVNKLTKPIWLGILIVAALILLATSPVGLLGIIAVVAVCVYLVDVRPRVDDIQHGGSRW
ncbi:DUF2516 family protein [Rhodococcus qingshengii]|uniref:DUF2516 family protein n=5 Tax=Rhodococcus erythropolis group TaxID=2840174 RepID=A0A0C2ZWY7_RHOER|nr:MULTISPECIES: DUF2516 family protein [Rhodococcus]EEN88689.1 hypothetical protein RHOER0001_1632 [Rhodococcus erythropolis SK121]MCD2157605.1 DUF2516 family protein [Rhodococcus cerastii]NHE68382.1 DUF2516 family protein [Rhodococcus sp. D-46]NRH34641.1 DUF2516 family protein [Rhodococcus sp. MS13]OCC18858.1 hypothetical protein AS590_05185 [Prescottella equi]